MTVSHLFELFPYDQEFRIDFCNEIFEFFHQHGVIGIDVASTSCNNGFGADLEFTQEIEFEKDFVLEDLKSLTLSAGWQSSPAKRQSSPAGRQSGRRGESRAAKSCVGAAEHF
ncbi:hypothetical protein Tco_0159121 [Tanacetum coccineum]